MKQTLYLDSETFSAIDIKYGGARYSEDCDVLLVPYALDDGKVKVWDRTRTKRMPGALEAALNNPVCDVVMHNGLKFDRLVFKSALGVDIPVHRIRDTMVEALMHGLPGSLGELCNALGIDGEDAKDKNGKRLINVFCKPLKENSKWGRRGFCNNLEVLAADFTKRPDLVAQQKLRDDWHMFKCSYAKRDITSMRLAYKRTPKWNCTTREMKLLALDTQINDRGVYIDDRLVTGALQAIEEEQAYLKQRALDLTGGEFHANQTAKLRAYLEDVLGYSVPNAQASTLEDILRTDRRMKDTSGDFFYVAELIRIRLAASSTSTAKYHVMKGARMADGRVRGMLQFAGASRTARWAGRIIQPQNFPRPTIYAELEIAIEMLRACRSRRARKIIAETMVVCASALRGCIIPTPGKKLVVADLSNIEGRGLAFLAGEEWKLTAFRAYDDGTGPDLYKLAYARAFNINPEDVTDAQRQIGKVMELGLGYGGGVGAFMQFAKAYNLDLYELADITIDNDLIPDRIWKQAHKLWHNPKFHRKNKQLCADNKITKREWLVCDSLKRLWREAHPETVKFWNKCEDAARNAIDNPGDWFDAGEHISFQMTKRGWLRMRLPSGRFVCYPDAQIRTSKLKSDDDADDSFGGDSRITYMGMYKSAKWLRMHTYSGKLAENATQAMSRDVLGHNMPFIERAKFEIILSVHDELLTETPDEDEFNEKELSRLMSRNPPWARKLPLNADGFSGYRYKK